MLLLHPPQNDTLRDSNLNEPDDVKELLQLKFGDKFVVLWNKGAVSICFQLGLRMFKILFYPADDFIY
jgi:hypothetical protein